MKLPKINLGAILIGCFVLTVVLAVVIPSLIRSKISANEGAAAAGLKTYNGMMATFKKSNHQGRGRIYPWGYGPETDSGKYCCLYYENNSANERLTYIGVADANADMRADGNTDANAGDVGIYRPALRTSGPIWWLAPVTWQMAHKAGYWFGMMMYYFDGEKRVPYDRKLAKDHYAIVAFPADYGSTGELTFIVTEEGTVYSKDRGKGGYLDTFPGPDLVQHGWQIAQ